MHKYKVSFLPTSRSRKMRSVFIYANNDAGAISTAKDNIASRHPVGELISVQRPDRTFIDMEPVPIDGVNVIHLSEGYVEDAPLTDAVVQQILNGKKPEVD